MHCFDVWVLFCLVPVSMALGALVIWGRGGRCFVVGVRWGKSVDGCSGLGTSVVEKGGYAVTVVGCNVACVRGGSLLAALASIISRDC